MARLPRISQAGFSYHIIQRGTNRQVCFGRDEDMAAYMSWVYEASIKYEVQVHAWVLMTNHVHLLVTPLKSNCLSAFMQYIGRYYVGYFNYVYRRTGTLWEGRFKSCVVQSDTYFLECQRYIELNPVRAKMVNDPSEYVWSSYRMNALGVKSKVITPHPAYLGLGKVVSERLSFYRVLFNTNINAALISDIRDATNKGLVLGTDRFKEEVEALTGRRVRHLKAGRKRKNELLVL